MGILDFLNPKNTGNTKENTRIESINSFEELKRETDRLRQENDAWRKEFNYIIKFREEATKLDKLGVSAEAIEIYLKSIDYGENSNRLNVSNYVHDIERVIILYGKTKQIEKQITFLEKIINTYSDYQDISKWKIRLAKLTQENSNENTFGLYPNDIIEPKPGNPTLGRKFQDFKDSLPDFNFYYDMPEGMQTFEYLTIYKPVPFKQSQKAREYKETFYSILSYAQLAENQNNLKIAIETYMKLIVEEYEGKEPFERLMIIYRKLKWKEQEVAILKKAMKFFEELKETQKIKIISLSKKYCAENKAIEYINANSKIQYYGGAFELYNPYPIINKWKERLKKLN